MSDTQKTKQQLIDELAAARERIAELEEAGPRATEAEIEFKRVTEGLFMYKSAVEQSADGIAVTDLQGNIQIANPAWAKMHGYEVDEIQGQHLGMFHTEEQVQTEVIPFNEQAMEKGCHEGEVGHVKRDGTTFPTWMTTTVLKDEDGNPVGLVGISRDISAQKEKEAKLRWFSLAVKQNPDGIAIADVDGNIQFANAAWAELHGYDLEEIQGQHLSIFHTEEQVQKEVIPFNEQVFQRGVNRGEMGHARKDGTVFPTMMTVALIRDEQDNPIGLVGIARDITQQKKVEEALRESESRFRDIALSTSDWLWEVDSQGRYTYCTEKVADVLGYTAEEMLGNTPFDLMPANEAARVGEIFGEIVANKQPIVDLENWNIHKDGSEVCLLTNGTPLLDQAGNLIGYRGVDKDITAQKRAQEERERLQQEVIEAQRRAIAELSTPVIPIMERIIVMPLVGSIDTMRARDITRSLLAGISAHRAKIVILDVTGVPLVDSGVANHLNKTIQAARLKGAHTIVTGISDAVAETIVDLGIDWSNIETLSDLQTGLVTALDNLGVKLSK